MADFLITNPALVTAVDTNVNHEIQFHDEFNNLMQDIDVAFIEVTSGTFKFNVGGPATEGAPPSYTGEKVGPISFQNGTMNINYVCTSLGAFRISF